MAQYANGARAPGICDRCGQRYRLHDLREESVSGVPRGNRVCPSCWDPDHPQNFLGQVPVTDAEGLESPRPDISLDASRRLFGWNPIGAEGTSIMTAVSGRVTVVVT
jgi:hypothetical protein